MRVDGPGLVLVTLAAVLFASACAPSPGEAIANRIRSAGSPLIREVVFRSENQLDPAETDVWLKPGVSQAEADQLWCEVVVPAGGSALSGEATVVVWNDGGTVMMSAGTPMCVATPAPRSSLAGGVTFADAD